MIVLIPIVTIGLTIITVLLILILFELKEIDRHIKKPFPWPYHI